MKIVVLGLDGTGLAGLESLAAAGAVPHLAAMLQRGASGPLRTIFPPVTAPAWLALATGLNPGKTGVYDYINRDGPASAGMRPVSSADYAGRALWDVLGKAGRKVGVFNYPTLSPAPEVNGFAVTGMGGYSRERLCHPASLEAELHRVCGGFENVLNLRNPAYGRDINLFFADIERILAKQGAAMRHLLATREWDFFFGVLSVTDWMQHVLWRHLDPAHPMHDPAAALPVQARYREVWAKIDELVGDVERLAPEGTGFVIVSDHGSGGLDSVFYPNVWLERRGWLARKKSWKTRVASWVDLFSEGSDAKYADRLKSFLRHRVLKIGSSMDLVDLDRSLACSPEHNTMFGCVNLTAAGRARAGFAEELARALAALPGEVPGIETVRVLLPGDLYAGPFVDRAPDVLFVVNEYRSTVEIAFARDPFVPRPSIALRTGGHREHGIFVAAGPAFRAARLEGLSILDVAPTLLALCGEEIPGAMDGAVITGALAAETLAGLTIRRGQAAPEGERPDQDAGDMEEMKGMLKSLGYL